MIVAYECVHVYLPTMFFVKMFYNTNLTERETSF